MAYWMHRDHPGDDTMVDMSKLLWVPASEVKNVSRSSVRVSCAVWLWHRCWLACA